MKVWKRNAIVATVLVLICAGVYLNWNAAQDEAVDLSQTLDAEQVMALSDASESFGEELLMADSFAQIRLARQESRDSAVELLQETIAYEGDEEETGAAASSLDYIVSTALAESQIESLLIAKGFADCVAYMGEDIISIAVSSPAEGLSEADVAVISDIVTTQSNYTIDEIRVIEVK